MKSKPWFAALAACLIALAGVAQANTLYVAEAAAGAQDGSTATDPEIWTSAFTALWNGGGAIGVHTIILTENIDATDSGAASNNLLAIIGCNTTINSHNDAAVTLSNAAIQYNDWNGECGPVTLGTGVTLRDPRVSFVAQATCGNGVLEAAETCDTGTSADAAFGYAGCTTCEDLAAVAYVDIVPVAGTCNNGILEATETCDPDVEVANQNDLGVCKADCSGFVNNPAQGEAARSSVVGVDNWPTITPRAPAPLDISVADSYVDLGFSVTHEASGTTKSIEIDFCDIDQEKSVWWARAERNDILVKNSIGADASSDATITLPDAGTTKCRRFIFALGDTVRANAQVGETTHFVRVLPADAAARAELQGTLHFRVRIEENGAQSVPAAQGTSFRVTKRATAYLTRPVQAAPGLASPAPATIAERAQAADASSALTVVADAAPTKWRQTRLFFDFAAGASGNYETTFGQYVFSESADLAAAAGLFFDRNDAQHADNDPNDFDIALGLTPDLNNVVVMRMTVNAKAAARFHTDVPSAAAAHAVTAKITPVPKLAHFTYSVTEAQPDKVRGADVQIVAGGTFIDAPDAYTKIRRVDINNFPATDGAAVTAEDGTIAAGVVTYNYVDQTKAITLGVCDYRTGALSLPIDVVIRRDNGETAGTADYLSTETEFLAVKTVVAGYTTDALDATFTNAGLTNGYTATFIEAASTNVAVLASDINAQISALSATCEPFAYERKQTGAWNGRIVDTASKYQVDPADGTAYTAGSACVANGDYGITTGHRCWDFNNVNSAVSMKADDLYAICDTTAAGDTLKVCVTTLNTIDGTASPNEDEHCVDWNAKVTPKAHTGSTTGAASISFAEGASTTYTVTGDVGTAAGFVTTTTRVEVFARNNNAKLVATFGAGSTAITAGTPGAWTSLGTSTGEAKAVVVTLSTAAGDNFVADPDALEFKTKTTVCHGTAGAAVTETAVFSVPVTVTPVVNPCDVQWTANTIIEMAEKTTFNTPIAVPFAASRDYDDEDLQIVVSASGGQTFTCLVNDVAVAGTPATSCTFACSSFAANNLDCQDTLKLGPGTITAFTNFDITIAANSLHATPAACTVPADATYVTRVVQITPEARPGVLTWAAAPTPHGTSTSFDLVIGRTLHEGFAQGIVSLTVSLDSISGAGCDLAHYSIATPATTWGNGAVTANSITVAVNTIRAPCAASCVLTFTTGGFSPDPATTHLNDPGNIQVTIQNDPGTFVWTAPAADLTTVIEGDGVTWPIQITRSLNGFATVPAVSVVLTRDTANDGSAVITPLTYASFEAPGPVADPTFAWTADEVVVKETTFNILNDASFSHMRCGSFSLKIAGGADFCALASAKTLCIDDTDSAGWETSVQAQALEFQLASSIGPVDISSDGTFEIAFSAPLPAVGSIPAGTFPFAYISDVPVTAAQLQANTVPACSSLAAGIVNQAAFPVDMAAGSCDQWTLNNQCDNTDCANNFLINAGSNFGACTYSQIGDYALNPATAIRTATWKFQTSLANAMTTCAGITAAYADAKTTYTIPAHVATILKTHPADAASTHLTIQNTDRTVALSVFNSIQASAAILQVLEANVFSITADYVPCDGACAAGLGANTACNAAPVTEFKLKLTVTVDAKDTATSFRAIVAPADVQAAAANCYGFPAAGATAVSHEAIAGGYTRTTIVMYTGCINANGANTAFATCAAPNQANAHNYGFRFQTTRCASFAALTPGHANHAACIKNDVNDVAITLRFEDQLPIDADDAASITATADLWHTTGNTRVGVGGDPTFTNDETIGVSIRLNDYANFPASFDMRVKTAAIAEVVATTSAPDRATLLTRGLFESDGVTLDRYYWNQQGKNAPFTSEQFFVKEKAVPAGNFGSGMQHCKGGHNAATSWDVCDGDDTCDWDMNSAPGVDSAPHHNDYSTWDAIQFPSNLLQAREYIVSLVAELKDCTAVGRRRLLQTTYTIVANSSNGAFVITNSVDTYALNYEPPTSQKIASPAEDEGLSPAATAGVAVGAVAGVVVIGVGIAAATSAATAATAATAAAAAATSAGTTGGVTVVPGIAVAGAKIPRRFGFRKPAPSDISVEAQPLISSRPPRRVLRSFV